MPKIATITVDLFVEKNIAKREKQEAQPSLG